MPQDSSQKLIADISVIIVSDYEPGQKKDWANECLILQALRNQDIQRPFQVLIVENESYRDCVPKKLSEIFPEYKIIFSSERQSSRLKEFGFRQVDSEYVAIVEADCVPNPQWLRSLMAILEVRSDVSIVSGKTTYGDETMWKRCLSLLDRSFDDIGPPGETSHVSNNGALYLRTILEKFPYPDADSPFLSGGLRWTAMRAAGCKFFFEPQAVMRHRIGGWGFILDFRCHIGFTAMMLRKRQTVNEIPRMLWWSFRDETLRVYRLGSLYLKWCDWPLMIVLMIVAPILSVPGMLNALKGNAPIRRTSYR